MDYKKFREAVWKHLDEYKRNELKITDNVIINGTEYIHILPDNKKDDNLDLIKNYCVRNGNKLILPLNGKNRSITLHTHWSHLNSSQILCISYFYPMMNNPAELNRTIRFINGKTGMNIPETAIGGEIEYEAKDKTSVDFVINLKNDKKIYFEIKYTEETFGTAGKKIKIGDKEMVDNNLYEELQKKYHSDAHVTFHDYKNNYQFVRNICLAQNGSYTLFLVPQKNDSINKNYEKAKKSVKNASDFAFDIIYWEELLDTVKNQKVFDKYFDFK